MDGKRGRALTAAQQKTGRFCLQETTIAGIQQAFADGSITARGLVELYLNRIEAYDRNGPEINSIITVNPQALEDALAAAAGPKPTGPIPERLLPRPPTGG